MVYSVLAGLGLLALISTTSIAAPTGFTSVVARSASLCADPGLSWGEKGDASCPICLHSEGIPPDVFNRLCIPNAPSIPLPKADSVLRRDTGEVGSIVPKSLEVSPDDEIILPDDFKNPGVLSMTHASATSVYRRDNEENLDDLPLEVTLPVPIEPHPLPRPIEPFPHPIKPLPRPIRPLPQPVLPEAILSRSPFVSNPGVPKDDGTHIYEDQRKVEDDVNLDMPLDSIDVPTPVLTVPNTTILVPPEARDDAEPFEALPVSTDSLIPIDTLPVPIELQPSEKIDGYDTKASRADSRVLRHGPEIHPILPRTDAESPDAAKDAIDDYTLETNDLLAQSASASPERAVHGKVVHQPAPGIFRREQRPGPEQYDNMDLNTRPTYGMNPSGLTDDLPSFNSDIVVIHQPVSDIYRRGRSEGLPSGQYPGSLNTEPKEMSQAAIIETHQPARGIYRRKLLPYPTPRSDKHVLDPDWRFHLGHGPVISPSLAEEKRGPSYKHDDIDPDHENWETHINFPEPIAEKRKANAIPPPEFFEDLPSTFTPPSSLAKRDDETKELSYNDPEGWKAGLRPPFNPAFAHRPAGAVWRRRTSNEQDSGDIVKRIDFKDHPMDRPALVHSLSKAVYRRSEMEPEDEEIEMDRVDGLRAFDGAEVYNVVAKRGDRICAANGICIDRSGTSANPAQVHQSKNSVWRRGAVVRGL